MLSGIKNEKYLDHEEINSGLLKRENIDDKYKWNLKDIYKSDEDWEKEFKEIENKTIELSKFMGTLGKSAENLLKCLKYDEKIGIILDRLHLYAMLAKDLDLSYEKYQGMYDRLMILASKLSAASSFIKPEILKISEDKLNNFINENKDLTIYRHLIDDLLRTKAHTLSADEERIMANVSPALQVASSVFGLLTNADLKFPTIKDENGNDIEITQGRYSSAMYSLDRDYRKRFYENFYIPFVEHKNTLGALFSGNIKAEYFNAQTRNYSSSREAALNANNIPLSVYDNLVNTVSQNLEPLHRWASLKKKILNLDSFHAYDAYVTLFPSVKKKYLFEDGMKMVLNSLNPLGDKYINDVKFAFNNRWIDVFETKSKRSGAYSSGTTFGVHPYVLLNWSDELNDIFTLTHEMGHNMHSYYTGESQPYPYANYSIFVAEVASTVNEALLLDYLIEKAESKDEKLSLIEKNINNIVTTFYRQTLFAKFEQIVHEINYKGEALTPDVLSKLYGELHLQFWGSEMTLDDEETYTWARVPHFYYNFYVYQYATSFAASETLSQKIKNEGNVAVEKYLSFLHAGSSDYPIEVLKKAGIDMTTSTPIIAITKKMTKLLDLLESLI
ncbi:MAG: oligoendopeptidase F [Bacteroidetes bacterium]|nr:oligoendopeptidase F [Bacteroidota bacterium]MBU1116567.1 oligoendopeptidase F [Bacteroidota bacterium]MBU1797543.1 oligoendopeptidase F [Bacteroidota bacterium]